MIETPKIIGLGAVTSVGLTAPQTCAAVRAKISGFSDTIFRPPPEEPQIGATVPVKSLLKSTNFNWLANLAARAVRECMEHEAPTIGDTALFIAMPENFRNHPGLAEKSANSLFSEIEQKFGSKFHPASMVLQTGHASTICAIDAAIDILVNRKAKYCIVGGVDSLINLHDFERLSGANRLQNSNNSQGLVPGEAASFILLSLMSSGSKSHSYARILGVGSAMEQDTVIGERYSVGNGLRKALIDTTSNATISEDKIDFLVSDMNGERYRAWESTMCHAKFYRTKRDSLNTWYPSSSVGDVGAASGALAITIAATAIFRGYAPGSIAMCESSSEEGLRACCLVGL